MSDRVPCPLCGNGDLAAAPSLAAWNDTVRNYVTIPRPQYEAYRAAKDALVRLHKLTGYVETEEALAALRAAGIDLEDEP